MAAKASTKAKTGKKKSSSGKGGKDNGLAVNLVARESYIKAVEAFGAASELMKREKLAEARDGFAALLAEFSQETEVTDRARVYLKHCERALAGPEAEPSDAEERYLRGVFELNSGRFDKALAVFDAILAQEPGAHKVVYASAVTLAQVGRKADAMRRLRQAIDGDSEYRILALNDPDFECVRDEPEFIDIVEPEESRADEPSQA